MRGGAKPKIGGSGAQIGLGISLVTPITSVVPGRIPARASEEIQVVRFYTAIFMALWTIRLMNA